MSDAIHLDGLVVRAARRTILDIARLEIKRGELVGLLGPNGSGKTTLLRCVLGMHRHVRGRVSVLGRSVERLGWGELAGLRRRIGYVPQLLPARSEMPLTVREVVAIGRTGTAGLLRPLQKCDWHIVDQWIDHLGLSDLAGRGFGEISGGQQRKTLIARAMVQQPELLLLDEPTANLDLGWRERIVQTIDALYRQTNLTIVLVCHELEVLPQSCRRIALLDGGRLIADGACEQVLSTATVESLYGAGLAVVSGGGRWAVVPGSAAPATAEADHA